MSTPHVALMPDLEAAMQRHTSMYAGMHDYAHDRGWRITLDEYADDTLPARGRKSPYDGVIARATRKLADRAARLGIPVVNVWFNSPVRDRLPGVFPDFDATGEMRAEHLLARGFERFAAVVSNTLGQSRETAAMRRTIGQFGFSLQVARVPLAPARTVAQWRRTESVIAGCLEEWETPIGVYVGGEDVARQLVQMCRTRGLRVPEDVAVISGDNEPAFCERPHPSLTSIDIGAERIGREAARLLHRLMDGEPPPEEPILLPPTGLVVRESTDFVAVEDEMVSAAIAFIAANAHRRIGRADVARAAHAEVRTLQNRFRKVLDRGIAEEIRRVRLERAKRELTWTKRRIADIARSVGFGESMRMRDVFVRELGITPSEYRRQRAQRAE